MLTFSKPSRCIWLALLLMSVNACSDVSKKEITESPFCDSMNTLNEGCQYEVGETAFWLISSTPEMPVEELIKLSLHTEQELSSLQGEIRGVSMYMGRIPVAWQQHDAHTWQAEVMLGACTDPNMVWELIIKKGSHSKRLPFQSVQY